MTVLVGVLCTDGVIVGSDSSATFGAGPNLSTIEQPIQKTFIVGNDLIFAATGAGGLGQRLEYVLQLLRQQVQKWQDQHHLQLAVKISNSMLANMQLTFLQPGQIGALVAFASRNAFHLCEFAVADFQPEMKTTNNWFVSMGSGQLITDPFFGMLRRTLFRHGQPTLVEGVLATHWALENAIDLNTGGINGPVQLAVLRRSAVGGLLEARLLGADELDEHRSAVKDVEEHLAGYRQRLSPPPTTPPPVPPPA